MHVTGIKPRPNPTPLLHNSPLKPFIPKMRRVKDFLAGMLTSGKNIDFSKRKKKIYLAIIGSVLLVAAVIGVVAGVKSRSNSSDDHAEIMAISSAAHGIVRSACAYTLHPELCYSAIVNVTDFSKKVRSQKDVIELSLNITVKAVQRNVDAVQKLIKTRKGIVLRNHIVSSTPLHIYILC